MARYTRTVQHSGNPSCLLANERGFMRQYNLCIIAPLSHPYSWLINTYIVGQGVSIPIASNQPLIL